MKPKDLVAKFKKQLAEVAARQAEALAAAEADGVSGEDRAAHVKAFDDLEPKKVEAKAGLKKAEQLVADEEEAARPATPPVVQPPHNPHGPAAGVAPRRFPRRPAGHLHAFRGPGAADRAYQAGMWAAAALYGDPEAMAYCVDGGLIQQAPAAFMGVTQNERGGYFVPDVLSTAIIELTETYGVFRRLAQYVPMGSETFKEPRWTGGMTTQWVGEGQAPADSEPTWDVVELVAKDLATKTKMSRQLDDDAVVALGDRIARYAAIAFSSAEDAAGFGGDGTSAYGGIVGLFTKLALAENAASVVTAPTGRDTVPELTMADYLAVVALYPEYAGADPRWLVTKAVWAQSMSALAIASGGTTPDNVAGPARKEFLGYPVEIVNALPKTYAAGTIPVAFGDLKLSSMFGDRRRVKVERGMENDDFSRQLFTLLGTERLDIVNHTVTDPKDATRPGPVVGLKLAAS